jgi:hypothetical protein
MAAGSIMFNPPVEVPWWIWVEPTMGAPSIASFPVNFHDAKSLLSAVF